jgi:UTP:GlnB (protein PII) uridylyltransferase
MFIYLLILIPDGTHDTHQQSLSKFLTFLWDVGLEVGHATQLSSQDFLESLVLMTPVKAYIYF